MKSEEVDKIKELLEGIYNVSFEWVVGTPTKKGRLLITMSEVEPSTINITQAEYNYLKRKLTSAETNLKKVIGKVDQASEELEDRKKELNSFLQQKADT